ncbi:MAG: DNA polymerase II [Proteobacteria bacterium]|nr:DNA polymerase II [Pseudomonadota bacterium]
MAHGQELSAGPQASGAPESEAIHKGFILTRHWRDTPVGTEIDFWLATDDGPRQIRLTAQESVAFAPADAAPQIERSLARIRGAYWRPLPLKTFKQQPVIGIYCKQYKQLLGLSKELAAQDIRLLESDVRPPERYLMERFIGASIEYSGGETRGRIAIDGRLKPSADYRPSLKLASLDIETSMEGDLYSIAIEGCGDRIVWMRSNQAAAPADADFTLIYCASTKEMLVALNQWLEAHDPDIVAGWNLVQFDLRILQRHAESCGIELTWGRDGSPIDWRQHPAKAERYFAAVAGRLMIDGIDALKAAMWMFPSYSLEYVSQALLGKGKKIDNPYDRVNEITRLFHEDKAGLARYNLSDCELVTQIFAKAKLLEFLVERANVMGLQSDHYGGSIAAFSHHYLPLMHRAGYVAPNVGENQSQGFPGGYVMDSMPGLYDSVLVLDYKSLYPSIIRTFLVDPVGLIEGETASDPRTTVQGINGTTFSRAINCLPQIVTTLWQQRDAAKAQRNEQLSQAIKLLMNAFCGVLGSPDCRFFDPRLVSAVTLRGHQIIQQTRRLVNEVGYETIYGDTDSIFISLGRPHLNDAAEKIAERLAAKINDWWTTHLRDTLDLKSHLEIEFDTHYRRFFMPTIRGTDEGSKKRYAGLTTNDDGSEEIVFRGLESARTDWTRLAQNFQRDLYQRVFRAEPYEDLIRGYVNNTREGRFDDLLVYRKRLRRDLKQYQRNVPPHVKAARLADADNLRHHRPAQYQNGGWISYVMTVAGPEPTTARTSKIDYEHYVQRQLQPIADAILHSLNDDFENIVRSQGTLF